MLSNMYHESVINPRTYGDWFQYFMKGDSYWHSIGTGKVFEDAELETLLSKGSGESKEELVPSLDGTQLLKNMDVSQM